MQGNVCTLVSSSKKWDTNSPPHRSKQTTQQPKVLSTARSNQNKQKQWTCVFTGYATEKLSNSFVSIGHQTSSTLPTTSPSTIQSKPTKPCNWSTSHQNGHLMTSGRETLHMQPTWLPCKYLHSYSEKLKSKNRTRKSSKIGKKIGRKRV